MNVIQALSAPVLHAKAEHPGCGAKAAYIVGLLLIVLSGAATLYAAACLICFIVSLASGR